MYLLAPAAGIKLIERAKTHSFLLQLLATAYSPYTNLGNLLREETLLLVIKDRKLTL